MMYPWNSVANFNPNKMFNRVEYAPAYYPTAYPAAAPGPNAQFYSTALITCLSIFTVWDVLLTIANYGFVIKLYQLNDLSMTIMATFLIVMIFLKAYSVVVGMITYLGPGDDNLKGWEEFQIYTIVVNAAGTAFIFFHTFGMFLPGTMMGYTIDFLGHFGTAGFSALLWKEYHKQSGWMLVPQSALSY